jgi:1-aminocyclopropane-1-carboxylate deaminase/D-cysteine desulfhydrase-like pyridoxal-dependent ACC family enzyme
MPAASIKRVGCIIVILKIQARMYKNIVTQTLRNPLLKTKGLEADVLRLDLLHPVISGNKWFKLKYHISSAIAQNKKGMVSFGGAYSNHLVAMAHACRENNLRSTGIIRGEEQSALNDSLEQMKNAGMELVFVSRESYRKKDELIDDYLSTHSDFYYVPEGGQSQEGIRGAEEILSLNKKEYTHIICSVGTGTTLAGLINASTNNQHVIGTSSLKISGNSENALLRFIRDNTSKNNYTVLFDYHFGGYAKKTDELISFMNNFYREEKIPTDFIYTAKMFYAVYELVKKNYFPNGSRLLLIHSGGLQGNRSLPLDTLVF